jgi:hypothetical protein
MNRLPVFLALAGTFFAMACDDQPTSPRPGQRPSAVILDGTHVDGNKDIFFLPPLVPNPSALFNAPFNPNLTPVFQVCPVADATSVICAGNNLVATFGDVAGATGPITVSPGDQHYLALWHTGDTDLLPGFYVIKVFYDETDLGEEPAALAHVQVVSSGRDLKTIDNQTIGLLDGRSLPIKVRFEGDCLSTNCISRIVTSEGTGDDPLVLTPSGDGALVLESGWLPPGVSQVRVTLQRHDPGPSNDCVGKAAFTGPALVAQTEACLQVTTDPVIVPGPETGIRPETAFIFACLEAPPALGEFMQIIKADDGRPLQALKEVTDGAIQEEGFDLACDEEEVIPSSAGLASHPLVRFASRALHAITRPVGRLLEVKPLYAIDLGQGGVIPDFDGFSYFAFGVQASGAAFGETPEAAPVGSVVPLYFQVAGLTQHPPNPIVSEGLSGIDVTFTITDTEAGGGLLSSPEGEAAVNSLTVPTGADGVATVYLSVGAGTNIVDAVGVVDGEAVPLVPLTLPVTFEVMGVSVIDFETYPGGSPVCDGAAACDVTGEYSAFGVTFSFIPLGDGATASICRTTGIDPAGSPTNHSITPQTNLDCSGWNNGAVRLTLSGFSQVQFRLRGNNSCSTFPVTATDATEAALTVVRSNVTTYVSGNGFTAREEHISVASEAGVVEVVVDSPTCILGLDNLQLTP